MRTAIKRGTVLVAAGLAVLVLPASAQALFDIAYSQTDSADPVNPGELVTYTTTVSNQGTVAADLDGVDVYSLESGTSSGVPNPNRSVSLSQGTCVDGLAITYQELICDLGPLAPGASAQIVVVAEANVSMDHVVAPIDSVDDEFSNDVASERTTVIVPPALSGDRKLKLKGLPEGCIGDDLALKARAKVSKVKQIKAKLTGKNLRDRLGSADGARLNFTVPASDLEQARFYELNVNATRKGKPGLKRSVELQRC